MILVLAIIICDKASLSTIDIPSQPRLQIFPSIKLNGLCDLSTEFPILFMGGGGLELRVNKVKVTLKTLSVMTDVLKIFSRLQEGM